MKTRGKVITYIGVQGQPVPVLITSRNFDYKYRLSLNTKQPTRNAYDLSSVKMSYLIFFLCKGGNFTSVDKMNQKSGNS